MSICRSLFQRDIDEIDEPFLITYFSVEREESPVLEFKSGETKLDSLHKEVSAFLNTGGGVLILGAPKEISHPSNKRIKFCKGPLDPSSISNRDAIFQSFASSIAPFPVSIRIKDLSVSGGFVYIIEVPQSANPPHQVLATGVYYLRLDRSSQPAPHGIVESLFFRRQKSNLEITHDVYASPDPLQITAVITIGNTSMVPVEYYGCRLTIFGAQRVLEVKNIQLSYMGEEELQGQVTRNDVLVIGMFSTIEISLVLRFPFFYFHLSYFSKDSRLEKLEGIYDSGLKDFYSFQSSKYPEMNKGISGSILDKFWKLNADRIKDFLLEISPHASLDRGASEADVSNLEFQLGIRLSANYRSLLLISDGLFEKRFNGNLLLYSVQEILSKNRRQRNPGLGNYIIGLVNERPIYLLYDNKSCPKYKLMLGFEQNQSYLTASIFELFEEIGKRLDGKIR